MPYGHKRINGRLFEKGNQLAKGKGRPRVPEEVRQARNMNSAQFLDLLNRYINLTREELQAKANDKSTPMLELLVIKILTEAIKHGNLAYFTTIVDRLIGKVPDKHQFTGSLHAALIQAMYDLENKSDEEPRDV